MEVISSALLQTGILIILLILGFIAAKTGILNEERNKGLSGIMINLAVPGLILNCCQQDMTSENITNLFYALFYSAVFFVVAILLATILIPKKESFDYRVIRYGIVMTNCGFMGVPFVQGILGEEAVFYLITMIVGSNLIAFTYGVVLLNGKEGGGFQLKNLFSPVLISIAFGLFIFAFQIKFPKLFASPIETLAGLNTPISMLLGGSVIGLADFRKIKHFREVLLGCFVRLLAVPIVFLLVLSVLPGNPYIKLIILIAISVSAAANMIAMSIQYNRDKELAANFYSMSVLLSMATVPFMIWLGSLFGITI